MEDLVTQAKHFYKEGYRLTDLKHYDEAIENYSKAIDLIPGFYEAIDNRAFCKMDMGRWKEAIDDFRLSLMINPKSFVAEFSIGECYLKSGEYKSAVNQFEKAIEIDPSQQIAHDFLKNAKEKI